MALVALTATTAGIGSAAFLAVASTVANVATVVATVANIGSSILARPPPARGSVTQTIIAPDAPSPYLMGEGYFAGVMRYRVGYGATLKKVPNPYLLEVMVYSHGGPVNALVAPQVDFGAIGSWYTGFLDYDSQLGACPESTALTPPYGAAPGWGSDYKLSGQAAIAWNHLFDKEGKVYASGLPVRGAIWQGVKVYDPRLDDTFPGGSGACRLGDETTYVYSDTPALHAGTYAFGRYQDSGSGAKKVMGIGLPAEGIDWAGLAAWANDCEANGWTMFGVAFEPGDKWANLRDICAAGGAEPLFAGAVLGFHWDRPRVALDTVTEADLADGEHQVTAMKPYRDRLNTIIPKYISADHNWELVEAEAISVSTYVTEDGEERTETWPFNFVKDVDQAAQLAAYKLVNARELSPITLHCKPRLRAYRPGECLALDLPQLGLDTDAVIVKREIDPATMTVTLTLVGETAAKHAFALGETGTPPPTPAIGQTAEERDELAAAAGNPAGYISNLISTSYVTDADPADGLMQATDSSITVENHTRTYSDFEVAVTGGTLTVEDDGTTAIDDDRLYHLYYDDEDRAGGAVAIKATRSSQTAVLKESTPWRHYVGSIRTDVSGGSGTSGGGALPPGWNENYNTP